MNITIISIGKYNKPELEALIEQYQKRLKLKPRWLIIASDSSGQANVARRLESEIIISKIDKIKDSYNILLDESGSNISSEQLSKKIDAAALNSLNINFIIGGAYGVDLKLKQKADFVWSLSNLVFPHQLVRLILVEQIYRAQTIASGSSYHHK